MRSGLIQPKPTVEKNFKIVSVIGCFDTLQSRSSLVLDCDFNSYRLSCVISNIQNYNTEIAYASRTKLKSECNINSPIDKEDYACINAI